ncbi:MAG TPA: cupin domain-containing protein [Baekduia sp.]|nr:cupin domain-containing protein [Baekduia sp.]
MSRYQRHRGAPDYVAGGYEAQALYNGESAVVIGSLVRAGQAAPAHHLHEHSDQLYYVTDGQMTIQLGAEQFDVGPETLVYIPKGTPHHNWNPSAEDEFHFEVLSPVPWLTDPIATATDSTDLGGRRPIIRTLEEVGLKEALPGFSTARLLQRSDGSEHMALYVGQVEPGGAGQGTHVHEFDQFYYVLEGELTVEVALQRFTAGPHDLVILPAGVPHRQWNEGTVAERHLTLLVPEPEPGGVWDAGVDFAPNGDNH